MFPLLNITVCNFFIICIHLKLWVAVQSKFDNLAGEIVFVCCYRCNVDCTNDPNNCISEKLFKEMADHLVNDGYQAAGYEYVNIDDCWLAHNRTSKGQLQPDPLVTLYS